MKQYRELEVKWLSIVSRIGVGSVKKDAKLKKLVRAGIPSSVRSRVWQFLAGANEYRQDGKLSLLQGKSRLSVYDVIDKDIPRCYPDHSLFCDPDGQGQRDLRILLEAYSHYNSELEYCQGMGRLAGCMLMHMPLEVRVLSKARCVNLIFWCLGCILAVCLHR